jgi:hypothetical protein
MMVGLEHGAALTYHLEAAGVRKQENDLQAMLHLLKNGHQVSVSPKPDTNTCGMPTLNLHYFQPLLPTQQRTAWRSNAVSFVALAQEVPK